MVPLTALALWSSELQHWTFTLSAAAVAGRRRGGSRKLAPAVRVDMEETLRRIISSSLTISCTDHSTELTIPRAVIEVRHSSQYLCLRLMHRLRIESCVFQLKMKNLKLFATIKHLLCSRSELVHDKSSSDNDKSSSDKPQWPNYCLSYFSHHHSAGSDQDVFDISKEIFRCIFDVMLCVK